MTGTRGYAVARKPPWNQEEIPHKDLVLPAPKIGAIVYGGIDRMLWEDFDALHYAGSLPKEMESIYQELERTAGMQQGLRTLGNRAKAERVLQHVNNTDEKNEIIFIESLGDDDIRGDRLRVKDMQFLGIDIYVNGFGSMIREGIFRDEKIFSKFLLDLNRNGLFDDLETAEGYKSFYELESKVDKLESFPDYISRKNFFLVYRVL